MCMKLLLKQKIDRSRRTCCVTPLILGSDADGYYLRALNHLFISQGFKTHQCYSKELSMVITQVSLAGSSLQK